jgi:hypothetical protein
MKKEELENLYLRSLDQSLGAAERAQLAAALEAFPDLAADLEQYKNMRAMIARSEAATFGPYFAQKIIDRLQAVKVGIDRQIMMFFKRYQLAAFGLVILLGTVNLLSAEKPDLPSVLGLEEVTASDGQPAPDDEDLLSFDLYENLNSY